MIRLATQRDVMAVITLAHLFSERYGLPAPNDDRAKPLLFECIDNGHVFVSDAGTYIDGCIVGIAMAHPFMDYTALSCLFVYSTGNHGAQLIRHFIHHGKELGVDAINASTHAQVNSERDRRLMSLLGFKATEVGWHLNL